MGGVGWRGTSVFFLFLILLLFLVFSPSALDGLRPYRTLSRKGKARDLGHRERR